MNDFDLYYQQEILPELSKFEKFRKACLFESRKNKLIILFAIILYAILVKTFYADLLHDSFISLVHPYYILQNNYTYLLPLSMIFLAICAFYIYKINSDKDQFSYLAKEELYRKIIGFFPNLKYQPFAHMEDAIVAESLLFPNFDFIYSEDNISGEYKGISIELHEIALTKIVQKTKIINNNEVIIEEEARVFKGLFLITNVNKKFSSISYVLPNRLVKIFNTLPSFLKRVTLEDPIFEDAFDVYSDDQIEARYLLTTSFMERLLALNASRALRCCFIDDKFLIALEQEEDFLPALNLKDTLDYSIVKKVIDEINLIFNIIDTLKLDMNIGL